jgi:hypothetical protein
MSTKYRIFCTEPGDEGWQYSWADTPLTTCPNNVAHSVNSNSVQQIAMEVESFRITPTLISSTNSEWKRIISFPYSRTQYGPLRRVKFIGKITGSITSFDVEVYDVTNVVSLSTKNFTNNEDDQLLVMNPILSPPSSDTHIEINVKKNGGIKKDEVIVEQIIIFGEK